MAVTADTWFTPLTPLAFLERSAEVFPDKEAIVYGDRRVTYREFAAEATRVAHALRASGVEPGDRVAYLLPNIPEMLVAHFAVPLAGAVLVAINTRLAPAEVRHILHHSGAKVLVVDAGLHSSLAADLPVAEVVTVTDPASGATPDPAVGGISYPDLLARGDDAPLPWTVADERGTISINYTSGTTGQPKGVMYHHRGAYLNSLAEIIHSRHTPESRYLWTLPMFHCNGWCTAWAVTAIGGTHVCLRAVDATEIWRLLETEGITHLNGAPTVLVTIASHEGAHPLPHEVVVTTAGAPPSPTVIRRMSELGARLTHVYGLTETYGPYSVCEPQDGWLKLDIAERSKVMSRQGVGMIVTDGVRVVDEEMRDVPRDGATMGEVVMRGNNVMAGYFDDPEATEKAFRGGWFHSGDLGVWHPDGYIQLRDRAKDIIVSGGENISTIEVEAALDSHPAVLEVAVVGVPHEKWGERPKAYVVLRAGESLSAEELQEHARGQIARYKVPEAVEFVAELPKTSTGKIQKFQLRERDWAGHEGRIQG
ncbi:acyl--CoA ligase family protein [Amycolatopsis acidiphila]|uniref:Long-chain-fatty-acid--CoA ligase n=1 Tax=Amycolatopsis acidiphila TaxID=715473 RepID=A0A558A058_9PSEU|nr:acyl--CoA ligase family protein [Amycolatopsis acidiphila]TVT17631.1 long-chain-fatty-acid--CoA ligase [Amycolatopsis acidiphila]UIJ60974.1 acyl--CoA ligase family protein [Amycolatopsis acidiphila]GHG88579.1 acyl-CoA synthetase [Amycolatopsis acidiphila]